MDKIEYAKKINEFREKFKNLMKDPKNFTDEIANELLKEIEEFEKENGEISKQLDIPKFDDLSWLGEMKNE